MSINFETLNRFAEIFDCDFSNVSGGEFYNDLLLRLENDVKSLFSGVYFLDEVSLQIKARKFTACDNESDIFCPEKYFEFLKFLNSKNEKTFSVFYDDISEFLNKENKLKASYFLFSKLLIKNSFFGFIVLAGNNPYNNDETSVLNLFSNIYSYMIKDYELNKVFKMQLSLLQEAIYDKESALKTIEKQNKKLVQADNAKTSFLANVSHELRTPLNAIIGFSDVLLEQVFGKLNDKQAEYIKDINLSSIHLMGLINSLLDFSKIESGVVKLNVSEFEPKYAVNEVINLLSPLLGAKEISLKFENKCNGTICADYQKFQQILFNLIGNAIKFSNQKGKIIVRTKIDEEYFVLEVEDFGVGIEKKYHNFIFKKFTQIDNIYTKTNASTGLGLAIVKEYVKLHKGKIYVISEPCHGSTFVVKLRNKA